MPPLQRMEGRIERIDSSKRRSGKKLKELLVGASHVSEWDGIDFQEKRV